MEGVTRDALYVPDGRHLYVSGLEMRVDDQGQPPYTGLGLRAIDLERGAITATALPGARINTLLTSLDGEGVYVFGPKLSGGVVKMDSSPYVLRRLDAKTFEVKAEREFEGSRQVLFVK